jgi:hypothetical protein
MRASTSTRPTRARRPSRSPPMPRPRSLSEPPSRWSTTARRLSAHDHGHDRVQGGHLHGVGLGRRWPFAAWRRGSKSPRMRGSCRARGCLMMWYPDGPAGGGAAARSPTPIRQAVVRTSSHLAQPSRHPKSGAAVAAAVLTGGGGGGGGGGAYVTRRLLLPRVTQAKLSTTRSGECHWRKRGQRQYFVSGTFGTVFSLNAGGGAPGLNGFSGGLEVAAALGLGVTLTLLVRQVLRLRVAAAAVLVANRAAVRGYCFCRGGDRARWRRRG